MYKNLGKLTALKLLIGLDSRFKKTPMIALKNQTVQSQTAFEDIAFRLRFENV
jgi:hypothetical protein